MVQVGAPTPGGLDEFLKGWGSLIVAAVALVQPWVIALWRKAFRPGTVDTHETGTIEVGYSDFGPTIALRGTLRAVHRDQFIRDIQLTVEKLKDGSKHKFDWIVFRAEKISAASGTEHTMLEIASGFMLVTSRPQRYSTLFADTRTQNEMTPRIELLKTEWNTFSRKAAQEAAVGGTAGSTFAIRRGTMRSPAVFEDFTKSKLYRDTHGMFERSLYWEPGEYSLEMRVNTARPEHCYKRKWTFVLTEADFQNLRLNAVAILREACGRKADYNFANPKYEKA